MLVLPSPSFPVNWKLGHMYYVLSLHPLHKVMMWWFLSPPLGKRRFSVSEGAKTLPTALGGEPPPNLVVVLSPGLYGAAALSSGWPLLSSSLQSLSSSPQAQPLRPAELSDEEVAELFQRLAEMQQEKWMLEEKVLSACLSLLGIPLARRPGWGVIDVRSSPSHV